MCSLATSEVYRILSGAKVFGPIGFALCEQQPHVCDLAGGGGDQGDGQPLRDCAATVVMSSGASPTTSPRNVLAGCHTACASVLAGEAGSVVADAVAEVPGAVGDDLDVQDVMVAAGEGDVDDGAGALLLGGQKCGVDEYGGLCVAGDACCAEEDVGDRSWGGVDDAAEGVVV